MAARRRKDDKSSVQVSFKMTAEEKAAAVEKAAAHGTTLSHMVREAINNYQPERPEND